MTRRKGSNLIEVIICISASTSLMLVAISLVHQTLTISSRTSQRADHDRSLARLASQFRSDAHRATSASVEGDAQLNMTWADDSEVVYRTADRRITRELKLASGQVTNESFSLDAGQAVTFQSFDQPERAALLIQRETGLHNIPPRTDLHVEAAMNRLQWAERGGEEARP